MRKVKYDEYIKQLQKRALSLYTRWAAQTEKAPPARKVRAAEEDLILFLLDRKRWEQALASGRIEKVGPRRYRWHG